MLNHEVQKSCALYHDCEKLLRQTLEFLGFTDLSGERFHIPDRDTIRIPAALLLAPFSLEGTGCFIQRVAEVNPHLAGTPYSPPLLDKRLAAEQMRLHIERVIAVLVPLGVSLLQSGVMMGHNRASSQGFRRISR